uniref:Uncharacterized protein n=1 Tax=Bionectria ochroleuca TaxID=29856 RepID=A0A8H7NFP2_BIOOC
MATQASTSTLVERNCRSAVSPLTFPPDLVNVTFAGWPSSPRRPPPSSSVCVAQPNRAWSGVLVPSYSSYPSTSSPVSRPRLIQGRLASFSLSSHTPQAADLTRTRPSKGALAPPLTVGPP